MDADGGHYESLQLQQRDNAVYEDLNTRPTPPAMPPDKRRCKPVRVGVGLLCAVLALISIAVPVYLYQSCMVERERLVNRISQLTGERDQSLDSINTVTRERDCLGKRTLCEQDGFTFAGGLCYYISTEKKNWTDSRQWCTDRKADLMVIKSKEKQDLVASFNERVWLGLTDREREGSFQWVDGTPLTRPWFWRSGQPDNHEDAEDCVEYNDLSVPGIHGTGWNDQGCSVSKYWMCERVLC